jgi:hypothetical protein
MRSSDPFFEEIQQFRQWWIWVILLIVTMFAESAPWIFYQPTDPAWQMILVGLIPVLVILWFYILRLETKITEEGICYRFFPVHLKTHCLAWDEIDKADVIKYHPVLDYGGWGIKFGAKGKAYNVTGNMGLMIHRNNGRKILIGTQKPEELKQVILKFKPTV